MKRISRKEQQNKMQTKNAEKHSLGTVFLGANRIRMRPLRTLSQKKSE